MSLNFLTCKFLQTCPEIFVNTYEHLHQTSFLRDCLVFNFRNITLLAVEQITKGTNNTAQKMKFSIKDFFGKCDQFPADLVTFTEEILNGKLHFLCIVDDEKISVTRLMCS